MQENILNHILGTYDPDAIILHGSRARGKERPHSDWDFILLFNQPTDKKNGREMFEGQNIEYSVYNLPITDVYEHFGTKLQQAKVLFEKDDIGTNLLTQANEYYSRGVHWSPEKVSGHRLWMQGRIDGMQDNIENPILFQKYFADLYGRVFNYWYWLLQNRHSQPIYIAAVEINTIDPEYYELVSALVNSDLTLSKKVDTAQKIYSKLFGEN